MFPKPTIHTCYEIFYKYKDQDIWFDMTVSAASIESTIKDFETNKKWENATFKILQVTTISQQIMEFTNTPLDQL